MNALTPNRFEEFFCALNGANFKPFPWQRRLAQRVTAANSPNRAWPEALALPTASGKTACLDVAIFALACQAALPAEERTAPRDRKSVV